MHIRQFDSQLTLYFSTEGVTFNIYKHLKFSCGYTYWSMSSVSGVSSKIKHATCVSECVCVMSLKSKNICILHIYKLF